MTSPPTSCALLDVMSHLRQASAAALRHCHCVTEALSVHLGDLNRMLRFTRGLLEFKVRPDDIFIVTYPRSGTTLMQHLLVLLAGRSMDDFVHISQAAPWFERSLAVGSLTAADLENLPSPRIFKSHLAYTWLPKGGRTIYITRDGQDVAVSYYNFYRSHLRYRGSFAEFFQLFLSGDLQYTSWFKHTRGWQQHRGDPRLLLIRFEELITDLRTCLERVSRFCRFPLTAARAEEIVAQCSFSFMKRHEQKFDFTTEVLLERGYRLGSFLRGGRAGDGALQLSEDQKAAFKVQQLRELGRLTMELNLPRFLQ